MAKVQYENTNENIYAINLALEPNTNDSIYSILGSGDVPFMFLENGANVFCIDYNKSQINFVNKRIDFLKQRNFDMFKAFKSDYPISDVFCENHKLRDKYFYELDSFKVLRNLSGLQISYGNIFDFEIDYSKFNKVYLSNVLDCVYTQNIPNYKINCFKDFADKFSPGTKFYLSGKNIFDYCKKDAILKNFKFIDYNTKDLYWRTELIQKRN